MNESDLKSGDNGATKSRLIGLQTLSSSKFGRIWMVLLPDQ
jgi:hypothetical protein